MDKKELNPNAVDVITSGVSATFGMIPVVGGALSELVHCVIPNQREDRIAKFVEEMSEKLEKMDYSIEQLKEIFSNYKYGAFTYKCIHSIVNDMYDEKIQYYKNLCLNGLTSEEIELNQIERILKIFSEMDYFEILYLKYYYYEKNIDRQQTFRLGKQLGIIPIDISRERSEYEQSKEISRQIALNNLIKNGLLEEQISTVDENGQVREHYKITKLGEVLFERIDTI